MWDNLHSILFKTYHLIHSQDKIISISIFILKIFQHFLGYSHAGYKYLDPLSKSLSLFLFIESTSRLKKNFQYKSSKEFKTQKEKHGYIIYAFHKKKGSCNCVINTLMELLSVATSYLIFPHFNQDQQAFFLHENT